MTCDACGEIEGVAACGVLQPEGLAACDVLQPEGLAACGVSFSYARNKAVLESVSASVVPGSFLAILGVNGCGKTTLLSCLNGLLRPSSGTVLIGGTPLSSIGRVERAKKISLAAQRSIASKTTVFDAVLLGRRPHIEGAPSREDLRVVSDILEEMGLSSYALRFVDELSGGEHQKVVLARAFAQQADVLLLDEPTNNLDPANQLEIMHAVRRAVDERGIAAAAVLHDVNLALRYCDRFLMVRDAAVAFQGGSEVVTADSIEKIYGMKVDIIEHRGRKVVVPW